VALTARWRVGLSRSRQSAWQSGGRRWLRTWPALNRRTQHGGHMDHQFGNVRNGSAGYSTTAAMVAIRASSAAAGKRPSCPSTRSLSSAR